MDQQNTNRQNRNPLRADGSVDAGESEKIKKLFRALAVLVVFISSLSLPMYISYKTQENAKEMRIKMDMRQLKNWAIIYKINNDNYLNLEKDSEVSKVFKDIQSMGGNAYMVVSGDANKYCCQANFERKGGVWCMDSSGYIGKDDKCSSVNISCE